MALGRRLCRRIEGRNNYEIRFRSGGMEGCLMSILWPGKWLRKCEFDTTTTTTFLIVFLSPCDGHIFMVD